MDMKHQGIFIIAEAGVNHNGSLDLAKELIDAAVETGVNAVKFQTFIAEQLVSMNTPLAQYQKDAISDVNQYSMLKKLELKWEDFRILQRYCIDRGIEFISSPFDLESVDFLNECLMVKRFKLGSGEITNAPLLLKIARTGKPLILSTGMSTLSDIEKALGVLAFGYLNESEPSQSTFEKAYLSTRGQRVLKEKVALLHCTTEYPAPFEDVNLRVMDTLRTTFGLPCGYSDHTHGIAVSIAAAARGAVIIEKHFTLDRNLPGPDHRASLEPVEMKSLVESVRVIEKALGNPQKLPTPSELNNRDIARKSIVAIQEIKAGEQFTIENIGCKRPGDGLSPFYYWEMLGRIADRDYKANERVVL